MAGPVLTPWPGPRAPTRSELEVILRSEGLEPHGWSNGPGDVYAVHSHTYHKVLYCVSGSIDFVDEAAGRSFALRSGDRMEIPPGTVHSAVVGPEGCACIEAARGG